MSSFQLTGYGSVLRMNQIGMCDKRAAVFRYIFNYAMVFILRDRFTEKQSINNDNSHKTKKNSELFSNKHICTALVTFTLRFAYYFFLSKMYRPHTHARTH